jgi:4-amino-4-deoxy-L-arabinose transferase-like glycosyltransferase
VLDGCRRGVINRADDRSFPFHRTGKRVTGALSEPSALSPARAWLLLALSLAGLLAVRCAAIYATGTDLYFDEAQYWSWAQEPAFGYFSKPPLLAWVIRAVTGVCGDGEFCVRLASPLMHTITPIFIFLAARALYGPAVGFWSALVFATVPGVSLSAGLISTDVPLLLFWSAALFFWIKFVRAPAWGWAVALGVALGLGLLSKYAMAYFLLCAALHCATDRELRPRLRDRRFMAALLIAALLIAPNVWWNIDNGLATFSHTAANAAWTGSLFHPLRALEFFSTQFTVFGPILFAALLIALWRFFGSGLAAADRLLVYFSLPVLVLITIQALLSRAHANWAAVAYPAAAILVTANLLRSAVNWFRASLAVNLSVLAVMAVTNAMAGNTTLLPAVIPYHRLLGWHDTAQAVRTRFDGGGFAAVLTDNRGLTAELLYYLRDAGITILAWRPADRPPRDHYQLTRPFIAAKTVGPLLFVDFRSDPRGVTGEFSQAEPLGQEPIATGPDRKRTVYFFRLSGFEGR